MRQTALLLLGLLLVPLTNLVAQQKSPVTAGTRVRLWAPKFDIRKQVGTVVAVTSDTLTFKKVLQATPFAIPIALVTRLEVSQSRKSRAGRGAVIGLVVGAASGVGFSVEFTNAGEFDFGKVARVFVPIFSAAGTGIGALIGAASRKVDHWESVPPPIRIGMSLHRDDGIALNVLCVF